MSKLSTKPYKGARDFYPEDKRLQNYLFGVMRLVCERFGYEEYDAPILEPTDMYLKKGNQEIIEEQTYTFTDRGDRSVTLRTEMTPTVARMVSGQRQELGYPLRWYSIPQCWRYERTQRGRGREFYQLNVDIFGDDSVAAEHELLLLSTELMSLYGAQPEHYEIRLNSRAFMNWVLEQHFGLTGDALAATLRLIDRIHKLPRDVFARKLATHLSDDQAKDLQALLEVASIDELPARFNEATTLEPLMHLMQLCESSNLKNVVFDPSITRGFDYYTDIVFEVFDTHPDNNRSMFGGGRYDNLLEAFGAEPVPTVGFGMGDHTLINFLELHDLLPDIPVETDIYAVCIGDTYQAAIDIVSNLRAENINVALDATGRKLDKCIKTADKKGIAHVLFIGQTELDNNSFTLRNINSGQETSGTIDELVQAVLTQ